MMLALAAGLATSLVAGGATRTETRTVVKSRVYLVKEPSFLAGPASRPLQRGEQINVELPGRGSWMAACNKDKERGYIHLSYVSRPPSAFQVSGAGASTGAKVMNKVELSGEVTMAVGYFCDVVERAWRTENPNMEVGFERLEPFMPVRPPVGAEDAAEPTSAELALPEPEAVAAFAAEGRLRMPPVSDMPGGEP
jgi:hypothetical protein